MTTLEQWQTHARTHLDPRAAERWLSLPRPAVALVPGGAPREPVVGALDTWQRG